MQIKTIKTRKLVPPQDDLYSAIRGSIKELREKSIVVVTSKVVAIHQGRCIKIESGVERDKLTEQEADWYVRRDIVPGEHLLFSIKNNTLIASAGIDKSNAKGYFVLWPEKMDQVVIELHEWFRKEYGVREIGVMITDSHVMPLRRGVIGTSLAQYGFNPLRDYRGKPDIFGEPLKVTITNVAEALAAAAVVVMGEASEQTPLAVVTDVPWVEFTDDPEVCKGIPSMKIPIEEDLFGPMLRGVKWKKGKGGRKS